jgi:hypothetical protein
MSILSLVWHRQGGGVVGLSGLCQGGAHNSTQHNSTLGWAEQRPAVHRILGSAQFRENYLIKKQ